MYQIAAMYFNFYTVTEMMSFNKLRSNYFTNAIMNEVGTFSYFSTHTDTVRAETGPSRCVWGQ